MMKINDNGTIREMTPEEVSEMQAEQEQREREYWTQTPYNSLVSEEIHKKYSIDDEMAIHRQREQKPQEYVEYFAYCETCKNLVKQKLTEYGREVSE